MNEPLKTRFGAPEDFEYFAELRIRGKLGQQGFYSSGFDFIDVKIKREEALRIVTFLTHSLKLDKP